MTGFEVDPDSLTAAGKVALRQEEHLDQVKQYISSSCSNFGAFSGVLNLFQGGYENAVATAQSGLDDSKAVARKVDEAFTASRDDYRETDRGAYDWFRKKLGPLGQIPAYVPAGSGNSEPGNPTEASGPGQGQNPEGNDPWSAPGAPWWVDKPVGQFAPGHDLDTPKWLNPSDMLKDKIMEQPWRLSEEYQYYRSLGYDNDEARELAMTDRHPDSQTRADTSNYNDMTARAQSAYDREYNDARANGASPAEARRAATEAGQEQWRTDAEDRRDRTNAANTAGTYYDLYNAGRKTVDGVNELGENIEQVRQNHEDLERYDNYENNDEDESAQEWAGR